MLDGEDVAELQADTGVFTEIGKALAVARQTAAKGNLPERDLVQNVVRVAVQHEERAAGDGHPHLAAAEGADKQCNEWWAAKWRVRDECIE